MRKLLALAVVLCVSTSALAAAQDNFDDNTRGPQWSLVVDNPAALDLAEQNGRLEILSTGTGARTDDALYLSNGPAGFRLSTHDNFDIRVDYSFTGYTDQSSLGDALLLVFGIGRDLNGEDSAAIGWGYTKLDPLGFPIIVGGLAAGVRSNDAQTTTPIGLGASSGTLRITYDSELDLLLLGNGDLSLQHTESGLVRGTWGADELYVSLGARGRGFATTSGQAYLDNFQVVTGTVIPEPATAGLIAVGTLLLRRR